MVDSDSLLDAGSHGPTGRRVLRCARRAGRTAAFAGGAVAAGLKRQVRIAMEFASRTLAPVPDTSRYGLAHRQKHQLENRRLFAARAAASLRVPRLRHWQPTGPPSQAPPLSAARAV